MARSVVRILFRESDFARLARSMAISFAFGSLGLLRVSLESSSLGLKVWSSNSHVFGRDVEG